jgi:hypothetical protein
VSTHKSLFNGRKNLKEHKNMKKILGILLLCSLLLSACGDKQNSDKQAETTAAAQTTVTTTVTTEITTTEPENQFETVAAYEEYYPLEKNGEVYAYRKLSYPEFFGTTQAAEKVKAYFETLKFADYTEAEIAKLDGAEFEKGDIADCSEKIFNFSPDNFSSLLSFSCEWKETHPSTMNGIPLEDYGISGINFDPETGEIIEFEDRFKLDEVRKYLLNNLPAKLSEGTTAEEYKDAINETVPEFWFDNTDIYFYIHYDVDGTKHQFVRDVWTISMDNTQVLEELMA